VEGVQRTFPDVSLGWNWRTAAGTPANGIIRTIVGQGGFRRVRREMFRPSAIVGVPSDSTSELSRSFPANLSIQWALLGGFATSVTYNLSLRDDRRPGIVLEGRTHDLSTDLTRSFKGREQWKLRSDIRTRLSFQNSRSRNSVVGAVSSFSGSGRLGDNGRSGVTFTADTEVTENAGFSLVGSRLVSFDNNFNRRFTQTVITAVVHLQFFSGDVR
jgi:hypothetical protein